MKVDAVIQTSIAYHNCLKQHEEFQKKTGLKDSGMERILERLLKRLECDIMDCVKEEQEILQDQQ